jgi:uncharacterized RDD family membrane protein YckC
MAQALGHAHVDVSLTFAGSRLRLAAALVDLLVVIIAVAVIRVIFLALLSPFRIPPSLVTAIVLAEAVLFVWLYYAGSESSEAQATPGKQALGLRVVRSNGEAVGFWRATLRLVGKIISVRFDTIVLLIAHLYVLPKQTLYDKLADTVVIRD